MSKQIKKGFSVFQKIIMVLLALIIVLMGVVTLLFGKETSAPSFGKYNIFINHTNNIKDINEGAAIISEKESVYTLQSGNVILCEISDTEVAPFRIYEIQEDVLGNKIYCVKTDSDKSQQTIKLQQSNIIAKCVQQDEKLGEVISFVLSGMGKIVLGAIPAVIIMLIVIVHTAFSKTNSDEEDEEEYEDDDEDDDEDDEQDDEEEERELQRQFSKKIANRHSVSKPSQTTSNSYSDKTILYNPQEVPLFAPQDIKDTDAFKQKKASISNNFGMNSTVGGSAVALAEREVKPVTPVQQQSVTPVQNTYSEEDVQRTAEAKVAEIKNAIQNQVKHKQQDAALSTPITNQKRETELYQAVSESKKNPYTNDNDILMEQIMQEAKNNSNQPTALERITEKQEEIKQVNNSIQAIPTVENTEEVIEEQPAITPVQQPVQKKVIKRKPRKPATFEDIMKVLNQEEDKLK